MREVSRETGLFKQIPFEIDESGTLGDVCLLNINKDSDLCGLDGKHATFRGADSVYLCEIRFSNDFSSGSGDEAERFLIKTRINIKLEAAPDLESSATLHKGFLCFRDRRHVYVKLLQNDDLFGLEQSSVLTDNYDTLKYGIEICLSGPYFLEKHNDNTRVYMLNYRHLLLESLKRQLYLYIWLILRRRDDSSIYSINYEQIFDSRILSFIINEKHYHFKTLHVGRVSSNEGGASSFIKSVFLVPKVGGREVTFNKSSSSKEELVYSSTCIETTNIINHFQGPQAKSKYGKDRICTLYIDSSYILNKYVTEHNLSLKVLEYMFLKIIRNISVILDSVDELNDKMANILNIQVNVCFYNLHSTFKFSSDTLTSHFSSFSSLNKVIYIEYNHGDLKNHLDLSFSEDEYVSLDDCCGDPKDRQTMRNYFNHYGRYLGLNCDNAGRALQFPSRTDPLHLDRCSCNRAFAEIIKLGGMYRKLVFKHFNMFLRLVEYSNAYYSRCGSSVSAFLDLIIWVTRYSFCIKSESRNGLLIGIAEILNNQSLIAAKEGICELINQHRNSCCVADGNHDLVEGFGLSGKDSSLNASVKEVVGQIDEQIKLHRYVNDNCVVDLLNQVYVPRILVYRKNILDSKLSPIKKLLYSHIKRSNPNYRVVYKHILNMMSPYFGQSENNIRKVFAVHEPTIIFLDGIDTISFASLKGNTDVDVNFSNFRFLAHHDFSRKIKVSHLNTTKSILYKSTSNRIELDRITNRPISFQNYSSPTTINRYLHSTKASNPLLHHDQRTMLTTLLLCLDNIEKKNRDLVVIAFSNKHISDLDDSITRAGRFDTHIPV